MAKEMLINVSEGEECRIALLADGKLEELYMERTSSTSHVGNIYKGKVTNVEPSIQAAFVDFGLGRNGFLHISDLMPTYFGRKGEDIVETVGKKMARRDRPPIQRCLRRGDDIVVQIIKEGIGTKGPTLSTYLSIPGRILVMMPGMASKGVSRKIEDDEERRRLRQILEALEPPEDCGFIIRTAGVGKSKAEIERDLKYLARLWETLKKRRDSAPSPVELYTEGDLVTRTVRDLFTADVDHIVIDSQDVAKRVRDVVKLTSPRTKDRVDVYEDPIPLFHKYGIEREIELMYSRHVPLPSGGSLVIDSTEAIVAIDVNSGKNRDNSDAEMTAFNTDIEAADEIARQLRLRDLGGVIICDFIDLRYERHRRELETRLHDHLKRDRAKTKMLRMSQFGIIEMTRQRMRPSFKRAVYFDCPHCKGAGLVKTPESMSIDVMRRIAIAVHDQRVTRVELAVCPDVAFYLQNKKRRTLAALEDETDKRVLVRADLALGLDEMRLELFDLRDGLVMIEGLTGAPDAPPHRTQLSTKPHGQGGRGGRFDNRRQASEQRRGPGNERGRGQRGGARGGGRDFEEEGMPDAEERMELAEANFGDDDRANDRPGERLEHRPEDRPGDASDELPDDRGAEDAEEGSDAYDEDEVGAVSENAQPGNRNDRGNRGKRGNVAAQDDRNRNDRGDRNNNNRGAQSDRGDRGGRDNRGGRDDRGHQDNRGGRNDRPQGQPQSQAQRPAQGQGPQEARGRGPQQQPSNDRSRDGGRDGGRTDARDGGRDGGRDRDRDENRPALPAAAERAPVGTGDRQGGNSADPIQGELQGGRRRRRRRGRRGRGQGPDGNNINGGQPAYAGADRGPGEIDRGPRPPGAADEGAETERDFAPDLRSDSGQDPHADWVVGDNDREESNERSDVAYDRSPAGDVRDRDRLGGPEARPDERYDDRRGDPRGDRDAARDESRQAGGSDDGRDVFDEDDDEVDDGANTVVAPASTEFEPEVQPPAVDAEVGASAVVEADVGTGKSPEAAAPESVVKRGRRRGGRGGGRGKPAAKAAKPTPKAKPAVPAKKAPKPAADGGAKKRTRGSRGGKGRGPRKTADDDAGGAGGTKASAERPSPETKPAAGAKRPTSTDRHLMTNEIEEIPVMHEPVRRPRTPRDLDHIPEDFD